MTEERFQQIEKIFLDRDEDQWDQELEAQGVTTEELQKYEQILTTTPEAIELRDRLKRALRKNPGLLS